MGFVDIILMVAIVGWAGIYLYRSLTKDKGGCHGCSSEGSADCSGKEHKPR